MVYWGGDFESTKELINNGTYTKKKEIFAFSRYTDGVKIN
jgi:hypothetical protein